MSDYLWCIVKFNGHNYSGYFKNKIGMFYRSVFIVKDSASD